MSDLMLLSEAQMRLIEPFFSQWRSQCLCCAAAPDSQSKPISPEVQLRSLETKDKPKCFRANEKHLTLRARK